MDLFDEWHQMISKQFLSAFYNQHHLIIFGGFTLPGINRNYPGQDVDTGRDPLVHQPVRNYPGCIIPGSRYQNQYRLILHFAASLSSVF
jgi:hypothetical protein